MLNGNWRLHDGTAFFAGTHVQAVVKPFHDDRELGSDVFQGKVLFMQEIVALFTVPVKAILHARAALHFHNEADGIRIALRGVRNPGRQ